jgi:hypothetical protein
MYADIATHIVGLLDRAACPYPSINKESSTISGTRGVKAAAPTLGNGVTYDL